ncbi:MAG: hypothetical protein J6Y62_04610 [Clostridia bacterium]|nr:hypothetical protein [Clostridia bacterium]
MERIHDGLQMSGVTLVTGEGCKRKVEGLDWSGFLNFPETGKHPLEQLLMVKDLVKRHVRDGKPLRIRTFSPEVTSAVETYSRLMGVKDLKAVVVSKDGKVSEYTDDWDPVYESFAKSFDILMQLKSDLEHGRGNPRIIEGVDEYLC